MKNFYLKLSAFIFSGAFCIASVAAKYPQYESSKFVFSPSPELHIAGPWEGISVTGFPSQIYSSPGAKIVIVTGAPCDMYGTVKAYVAGGGSMLPCYGSFSFDLIADGTPTGKIKPQKSLPLNGTFKLDQGPGCQTAAQTIYFTVSKAPVEDVYSVDIRQ